MKTMQCAITLYRYQTWRPNIKWIISRGLGTCVGHTPSSNPPNDWLDPAVRFCSFANFALHSSTNFKCVVPCDTVPTWSVRKYQHELKSWSLFNFAIYHTFCNVWNVQNYVIALIKQTLQFHSNSFMFVSLVAINRTDWSARRSQHGLGLGSMGTHHMSDFTCWLVLMMMMTRFRCKTCAWFWKH